MRIAVLTLIGLSSAAVAADFHAVAVHRSWDRHYGRLTFENRLDIYWRDDGSRMEVQVQHRAGLPPARTTRIWNVPAGKTWRLGVDNPPDLVSTEPLHPNAIAMKTTKSLSAPGSNPAKGICTSDQDKAEHSTILGYDVVVKANLGMHAHQGSIDFHPDGSISRMWFAPELDCEVLRWEVVFVDSAGKTGMKVEEYLVQQIRPGKQADERFTLPPGTRMVPPANALAVRP